MAHGRASSSKVGADDAVAAGMELGDLPREELRTLEPEFTHLGDALRFTWPTLTVEIQLSNHRDHSDGLRAELSVRLAGQDVHWGQLNLAWSPSRAGIVKALAQVDRSLPWREMLEHVCRAGARALRTGEPVVCLMPIRATETRYLIAKLALAGETNVLFGDGGSGKSLLALALALATGAGIWEVRKAADDGAEDLVLGL